MPLSGDELHRAAVEHANRGQFGAANRTLDRAAATAVDADLRARIDGTRAYVAAVTGRPDDAERLILTALAEPGLSPRTAAILAGQLASLEDQRGKLDEADRWVTRAIDALETAGDDPLATANLLVNRSVLGMRRRQLLEAAEDTRRADGLFLSLGETVAAAQARHNLGYIELLRGDIVLALREMSAARDVLADLSDVSAAIGDVDRAEVLRDAGATRDAEQLLTRAAAVFGARRMQISRAEAELQLARSLLVHDPSRARRVAAAAERRFRRHGNESAAARAAGIRVRAALRGAVSDPPRPRSAAVGVVRDRAEVDDAVARLQRTGQRHEAVAVRITATLADAAHGRPPKRMPRIPATSPIEVHLLAAEARAARATAIGRHSRAREEAAEGLDALARWQDAFGSLDLQTSVAIHGTGLIHAGLASAVRSGRPAEAFEWSERARHLSQQILPLRPPPDPGLAADLATMRVMRFEDADWLSRPGGMQLRERARSRQWSTTGAASRQTRIGLDDLRDRLGGGSALLSFIFTGEEMAALVVDSDVEALLPVPGWPRVAEQLAGLRADLDVAAGVRAGPLADVVRRSLERRLAEVSDLLLGAALQVAGSRRLVVTAPGELAGLPWSMLPGFRGRIFTLATSATRWARQEAPAAPPASAGFVVGPRVARGEEEVAAGAMSWSGAAVLSGPLATVAATAALAESADVLHVAAHGRHAVDNPLFSGLELADGALFGYDVDLVARVPGTVVLSSCEAGRSSVRGGEEAIGMTRVWLHAGTRAVVATPVVVADDDACELLGAMHAELALGVPPSEALAAASVRTGIVSSFQVHGSGF